MISFFFIMLYRATNTQRVTDAMTSMIRDINNLAKSGGLNFNVDGRTYSPSGIGAVPSTANEECGSGQYRSGQACGKSTHSHNNSKTIKTHIV